MGKANPTYAARFTLRIATNQKETQRELFLKTKQETSESNGEKRSERHRKAGGCGRANSRIRWLITIFVLALGISAAFSLLSQELLSQTSLLGAFAVLLAIIGIGILFDLLGVAVTAAEEKPFHSMAARKVPGSTEGIWLLRNASKVSSVCNDVVGDICGIISGTAAAVIAIEAWNSSQVVSQRVLQLVLSALVAALTILGKAFCKQLALDNSTAIVHGAAKLIWRSKRLFKGKQKRKK